MGNSHLRVVVVLLVIAASLSAATAAGTPKPYLSKRFHYSLAFPAGFKIVRATSDPLPAYYPTGETVAADRYLHGAYKIVVDSLPTKQSLAAWTKSRAALISQQFGCDMPRRSTTRLGGASAVELDYKRCSGEVLDVIEAIHNGRGYDVYWLGATNVKPVLARDVSTFRFLP